MTIEQILKQAEEFVSERYAHGSKAQGLLVDAVKKVRGGYSTACVPWQFILNALLAELMSAKAEIAARQEQDKILSNIRDVLMR